LLSLLSLQLLLNGVKVNKFRAQALNSTPRAAAPIERTHGCTGREEEALEDMTTG
jgi:hypothetical protein